MSDAVAVVVPRMNTNDDQAVLVRWLAESGGLVTADQPLAILETTKATFEVNAPAAGYLFFQLDIKVMVDVGAAIAWISDAPISAAPVTVAGAPVTSPATVAASDEARISRKALRLMKDNGLTVDQFPGEGRIEVTDVERLLATRTTPANVGATASAGAGTEDAEPLAPSPSKMIEAATLERIYRQVVPSTVVISLDESRLQARLAAVAATSTPVSVLELVIFELTGLLTGHPELNGYYANGRAFTYRRAVIGFAINAAGQPLKVPVLRNCPTESPLHIARAVRDLALRYMRDELTMDDLIGGTFTVTDLSSQDVVHFVPVLNDRQSAILGICAPRAAASTRDLVLTFDHRMSDGMRAATFLGELRERLEA